jgi:hypothetical protein
MVYYLEADEVQWAVDSVRRGQVVVVQVCKPQNQSVGRGGGGGHGRDAPDVTARSNVVTEIQKERKEPVVDEKAT